MIVKGLVDALMYMRKQLILHGNLNPDHILLTEDLRPVRVQLVYAAAILTDFAQKLSGFTHAVRLPTADSTTSVYPSTNACTAPSAALSYVVAIY